MTGRIFDYNLKGDDDAEWQTKVFYTNYFDHISEDIPPWWDTRVVEQAAIDMFVKEIELHTIVKMNDPHSDGIIELFMNTNVVDPNTLDLHDPTYDYNLPYTPIQTPLLHEHWHTIRKNNHSVLWHRFADTKGNSNFIDTIKVNRKLHAGEYIEVTYRYLNTDARGALKQTIPPAPTPDTLGDPYATYSGMVTGDGFPTQEAYNHDEIWMTYRILYEAF